MESKIISFKSAPEKPKNRNKLSKTMYGIVVLPLRVGAVSTIRMVNGHEIETLSVVSIREISEQTISYETSDTLYTVMRPRSLPPEMTG